VQDVESVVENQSSCPTNWGRDGKWRKYLSTRRINVARVGLGAHPGWDNFKLDLDPKMVRERDTQIGHALCHHDLGLFCDELPSRARVRCSVHHIIQALSEMSSRNSVERFPCRPGVERRICGNAMLMDCCEG
jgi:hypothetical protein